MKNLELVKTLYEGYPYIVKVIPVMEKKVLAMGLSSGGIGGYNTEEVCNLANAMLDMIERKKELTKIKKLIDKVVRNLPKKYARVMIGHYMQDMPLGEIAKVEKTTYGRMRTRYNNALDLSKKMMQEVGYTDERILEVFKQEKWLRNMYEEKLLRSKKSKKTIKDTCGFVDYNLNNNQKSNSSFVAFLSV